LFTDEKEGMSIAIPLVAGELDPEWPREPLTAEKTDELLQWMFAGAARAYRYFEADRHKLAHQAGTAISPEENDYGEPFVRSERKIGRNETCPCRSGKKFSCNRPPGLLGKQACSRHSATESALGVSRAMCSEI
jgi:hypothetical protein